MKDKWVLFKEGVVYKLENAIDIGEPSELIKRHPESRYPFDKPCSGYIYVRLKDVLRENKGGRT